MIRDVLDELKNELPPTVKLVAVSKYHPFEAIVQAYEAGQRVFAESRPQELFAKEKQRSELVKLEGRMSDLQWHFIGHLQTNKLRWSFPMFLWYSLLTLFIFLRPSTNGAVTTPRLPTF